MVDTEDGQVASVTLTLDPDEEVRTVVQGCDKRHQPGWVNAAGKLRQKW